MHISVRKTKKVHSIKRIYIAVICALIFIMIIVMTIMSVLTVRSITVDNNYLSMQAMEKQAINTIGETVRTIERLLDIVSKDNSLINALRKSNIKGKKQESIVNDNLFYMIKLNTNIIKDIYLIGDNGTILMSTPRRTYSYDTLMHEEWYAKITQAESTVFFDTHYGSFVDADETSMCFSIGKKIEDPITKKIIGVALVDVYYNTFVSVLQDYCARAVDIFFFTPKHEQILDMGSGIMPEYLDFIIDSKSEYDYTTEYVEQPGGRKVLLSFRTFADGYVFISRVYADTLEVGTMDLIYNNLIFSVLLLGIGAILASILSVWITKPILNLCDNMTRIENGDLTACMPESRDDEIGRMSKGFNAMVQRIDTLIKYNKLEQERLRRAQIQMYQEQIKPHFLYNTLDSIIWMVNTGDNKNATVMLYALADFFKIGLNNGAPFITLSDEINYIQNYLTIQKIRYRDKLNYDISIPKMLEGVYMPRMVLQPLVENALYHGLKQKKTAGTISILIYEEYERLHIIVSDTGVGIMVS